MIDDSDYRTLHRKWLATLDGLRIAIAWIEQLEVQPDLSYAIDNPHTATARQIAKQLRGILDPTPIARTEDDQRPTKAEAEILG